jgi:polar amino acid transport system substrate-binding protein
MRKAILLMALLSLFASSSLIAETITFALGDYEPYTSKKNPEYKLAEKVVTEAFALEGIDVKYEYYPWSRSYGKTEDGTFLGTFPWGRTGNEEKFLIPKEPIFRGYEVFFYDPNVLTNFDWKEFSDLKGFKIGGSKDYEHVALFKKHGLNVEVVANEDSNFKKLNKGRLQLYATNPKVAAISLEKLKIKGLKFHPKKFLLQDQVILFSNKNPNAQKLADAFDRGVKKLKASGRYAEIMGE